jgi:hypothetical protein
MLEEGEDGIGDLGVVGLDCGEDVVLEGRLPSSSTMVQNSG